MAYNKKIKDDIWLMYQKGYASKEISDATGVSQRSIQYLVKSHKEELKKDDIEKNTKHRVLVVGDLHCPFDSIFYLNFLKDTYEKYSCDTVVFIGDLVDISTLSHHPVEPDAYGTVDEIEKTKEHLAKYISVFPNAKVCFGNHDIRMEQRAADYGIDKRFMKSFQEIFDIPITWEFAESWNINNVLYVHGTQYGQRNILTTLTTLTGYSTVMGHQHTLSGIIYSQGKFSDDLKFAMAVGSGIDNSKYAFRYNKGNKFQPVLSCGVVLSDKEAYIVTMKEEN